MSKAPEELRAGRGRIPVLALLAGALLVAGYFAFGMPGMDHGTSSEDTGAMDSMNHASMPFSSMDPGAFAEAMAGAEAFVVNVHTPYEGEVEGTDAFIPYERVRDDDRLRSDKDTEILLYCRTGRMSAIVAQELADAGYTNVSHLEGGMDAWQAQGMTVRMRAQDDED